MSSLTKEQGVFELTLLNAEMAQEQLDNVMIQGLNMGIAPEIMTRIEGLWGTTKLIAGEVVAIGKIVVLKIFEFLKANPNLGVGLALGAAVSVLMAGIPFLGAFLAPLGTAISMIYGAAIGSARDDGNASSDVFTVISALAQKFFELIHEIFFSVKDYLAAS